MRAILLVLVAAAGLSGTARADEVAYGSHPQQRLDTYRPASGTGAPLVLLVHGGAWWAGDKAEEERKARALAEAGYVVGAANYRLVPRAGRGARRPRHPAQVQDVARAAAWLVRNAQRLGGDPRRLFLMGHSAGGQLVSLAGTDPRWLRAAGVPAGTLRGVVSLDPEVLDVRTELRRSSTYRTSLLHAAFGLPAEERRLARWRQASPLASAGAADPPQLVVTQQRDAHRKAMAARFVRALGGAPSRVLAVPYDHLGISDELGADDVQTPAVLEFLRSRGA